MGLTMSVNGFTIVQGDDFHVSVRNDKKKVFYAQYNRELTIAELCEILHDVAKFINELEKKYV